MALALHGIFAGLFFASPEKVPERALHTHGAAAYPGLAGLRGLAAYPAYSVLLHGGGRFFFRSRGETLGTGGAAPARALYFRPGAGLPFTHGLAALFRLQSEPRRGSRRGRRL